MEFRRSLTLSFLFKFNLEVVQKLRQKVRSSWSSQSHLPHIFKKHACFAEHDHGRGSREDRTSTNRDPSKPAAVPGPPII